MHSRIYTGWVRHRRNAPVPHRFRYRLFMLYLDLAELPHVFDGIPFWSARHRAPACFRRSDYLGPPELPLDTAVRDLVERRIGRRPSGPIRLLTHLRYFGYCMNPVSFYYCFDAAGLRVETIVAEITNTPWKERHQYVLPVPAGGDRSFVFDKRFHVSPFLPMNMTYRWRLTDPADRLAVHMENFLDGRRHFDATLVMRAAPICATRLVRALARFPLMSLKVIAAIHWQALKLWLKRTPVFDHPGAT